MRLNYRMAVALGMMACLMASASPIASERTNQSQESESEQTVWTLEQFYWFQVQHNDLAGYLGLWHKDFLGWPSVSAKPVHKDHITDWITSQTSKGLKFHTAGLLPAGIQITGDIAVTCYWMTFEWQDKDGKGTRQNLRVTHTWVKEGKDWRIIGGMSMPEPATP